MNIKSRKKKGIISLIIAISLIVQTFIPKAVSTGAEEEVGRAIDTIASVYLKDDKGNLVDKDTEYPIEQGSKIFIYYTWRIDNGEDIEPGDYTKVKLPLAFKIFNEVEGDLLVDGGVSVGKFKLGMDGTLILTYNEYAKEHSNVEGTVKFSSEFDKSNITGETPVKIVFPISESSSQEIDVRFKPANVSGPIEKSGLANKGVNADRIKWTIDVNKTLENVDNALVEDAIGEGLELDKATIKVYRLRVNLDGTAVLGDEFT